MTALGTATVLATPNKDKGFIVNTDASGLAVGAVILQEQEDGNMRPSGFSSHKLDEAQQQWPVHDREMYAFYYAFTKWRSYHRRVYLVLHVATLLRSATSSDCFPTKFG